MTFEDPKSQVLKNAKRVQGLRCIEARSTTLPEEVKRLRAELAEVREQLRKAQRIDLTTGDDR